MIKHSTRDLIGVALSCKSEARYLKRVFGDHRSYVQYRARTYVRWLEPSAFTIVPYAMKNVRREHINKIKRLAK